MKHNELALRCAALELRDQLARKAHRQSLPTLPPSWRAVERLVRQYQMAIHRGWNHAARNVAQLLSGHLDYLRPRLDELSQAAQQLAAIKLRSVDSIYENLADLAIEFDGVHWDRKTEELVVTTAPITLEEIPLGPFEICLCVNRPGGEPPYRIRAVAPHPAASNDSIVHPHVDHSVLCEGDGHEAVHRALKDGRLFDFFTVVRQILCTHHAGSAYLSLDEWSAMPCRDCGELVLESDEQSCEACGKVVCGGCSRSCQCCDQGFCSGCVQTCPECDQAICSSCMENCARCGQEICPVCRVGTLCDACKSENPKPGESANAPVATQ